MTPPETDTTMRMSRVFHPIPLHTGAVVALEEQAAHHLVRVLRLPAGAPLILFDGTGGEYEAVIDDISKRGATARVGAFCAREAEPPLRVVLAQGISRGQRMDYTLQKAVELGVGEVIPLVTERCGVRLDEERGNRKLDHWRGVAIAACEQCGRNRVPGIGVTRALGEWLMDGVAPGLTLVLDPDAGHRLADLPRPDAGVTLLIGPEGGLSDQEIARTRARGFTSVRLGPRVLRTETAAVAALTAVQVLWGDLAGSS